MVWLRDLAFAQERSRRPAGGLRLGRGRIGGPRRGRFGRQVSKDPIDKGRRGDFLARLLRLLFLEAQGAILGLEDGGKRGVSLGASVVLGTVGDLASDHREAQLKFGEVVVR